MIPLHKVPQGLLAILRARTLGRNPDGLSEGVVSVINATPMYGSDLQVASNDASGAGAVNGAFTGRADFPGRSITLGGRMVMGAAGGTFLRLQLAYAPGPAFQLVPLAEVIYANPVAGSTYTVSFSWPEPCVFGPGAQFQFTTVGDAGGADHARTMRHLFENYSP